MSESITAAAAPVLERSQIRRNVVSATAATALEYYDFALYGLAAALVLNTLFFPNVSPAAGILAAFATHAVGFLARPFGGVILGWLGDRIGRKTVLIITVGMMGAATTAIGLLPTYAAIGVWAPVLLVLLRIVQGFGAGAELAGASALLTESAGPKRRGLMASFVCLGTNTGTLAASGIWLLILMLPDEQMLSWGWRIPFLLSIVVTAWAFWMRWTLGESPTFEKTEGKQRGLPIREVYSDMFSGGRRMLLTAMGLRIGEAGPSVLFQVFFVGFAANAAGGNRAVGTAGLMVASVIAFVTSPLIGWMSDRHGRRIMFRWLSGSLAILAFPLVLMLQTGRVELIILSYTVGFGILVYGLYAVESSYLPELFGSRYRYSGIAVAKEFGGIVSGGIAPLVAAALVTAAGHWWPLVVYLALLAMVSFVTTFFSPETAGRDLVTEANAG
jgi:MFS transporter, MHS family, metabolite:H+ symporter